MRWNTSAGLRMANQSPLIVDAIAMTTGLDTRKSARLSVQRNVRRRLARPTTSPRTSHEAERNDSHTSHEGHKGSMDSDTTPNHLGPWRLCERISADVDAGKRGRTCLRADTHRQMPQPHCADSHLTQQPCLSAKTVMKPMNLEGTRRC